MTNHSFLSSIPQILLMLFGSTLIMGGACALNNYYDQDIDRIMPSKQNRPTVNNRITDQNLLLLSFGMMLVGEICFVFIEYTIRRTWSYGDCRLCLITQYGLKRHTTWNTVIGSFPGAVPPLIGWA